jgi:protoporphyrinogen oxidase
VLTGHDLDPEMTKEVRHLLGADLKRMDVPSQIYHNGQFIDFPLSPFNLMRRLGSPTFVKASFEVLRSRLGHEEPCRNFQDFARRTYGKTVAGRLLLNYSEKLWGTPCERLSMDIAGERLRSLDLTTFITEAFFGRKTKTRHMEGSFYYPRLGYGMIAEKMGAACGETSIRKGARITRVLHDTKRIRAVEVNEKEEIETDEVVSTLPLNLLLGQMVPPPAGDILALVDSIRYRNVILVALFLDRPSVTEAATVYFPDATFPFTRVYEPRNRSRAMSPSGKTSLVAEIPCQDDDTTWRLDNEELSGRVRSKLVELGWIRDDEILDATIHRMRFAYPILEIGFEEKIQKINVYLGRLSNLKLSGRSGKFVYSWLHDMMRFGKKIVEEYEA